jgi:hypothetical protein
MDGAQRHQRSHAGSTGLTGASRVPTISLNDDELAAVVAALRDIIDADRYPHAPRLDPLKAALGKLEAAAAEPTPPPETPPPGKVEKRAR